MQGLILLTAMSASGGLFGGKTACATRGHCVQRVATYATAPVAPAAQSVSAAPAARVAYQSYYSVGSACATGNCPRR